MARSGAVKGLRISTKVHPGVGTKGDWAGVDKQSDPGAVADNEFTNLINVRVYAGKLICRGGQSKLNSVSIGAAVTCDGFFDASDTGA